MLLLVFYYCIYAFLCHCCCCFKAVAFKNSTLTGPLHYMALHCITSTTTRTPPPPPPTNLSLELSPSLHSWRDSGARGTFSATTESEAVGALALWKQ